jgi:hypothetical protein
MIAFVHIQKSAGTTLKFVLRNSLGLAHCDVQPSASDRIFRDPDLALAKRVYPWLKSISGHSLIYPTHHLSEKIDYFTFFREPLQRCASHYQYHLQVMDRHAKFEDWINDPAWQDFQVKKIAGEANVQKAIDILEKQFFFVGLTESFGESLQVFKALAPYRIDPRYASKNVASNNEIKNAVLKDERKHEMLAQHNQLDQQLLAYVKEHLYPGLREKALAKGATLDVPTDAPMFPWRFHMGRIYYKGVYRQAQKRMTAA